MYTKTSPAKHKVVRHHHVTDRLYAAAQSNAKKQAASRTDSWGAGMMAENTGGQTVLRPKAGRQLSAEKEMHFGTAYRIANQGASFCLINHIGAVREWCS